MTHNLWLIKNAMRWQDWWTDNSSKTNFISKDTFQNDMFLTFLTNWSRAPHIDPLNLWNCFHINSFVHFVIHTEWWYLKISQLTSNFRVLPTHAVGPTVLPTQNCKSRISVRKFQRRLISISFLMIFKAGLLDYQDRSKIN